MRRTRRARPVAFVIALGVGLALIVIGLVAVFGLILEERAIALGQLEDARRELEVRATAALEGELTRALATNAGEVEAALEDPLLPSDHLLLVDGAERLLPRGPARAGSEAARLLDAAREGRVSSPEDTALEDRLRLSRALPDGYEDWLAHRRRFVLRIDLDLASTLLALERLEAAGALEPSRAAALLRDGVPHPERDLQGWLRALVGARARLSEADFTLLIARGTRLARRALVRVDDVLERARATPVVLPAALTRSGTTLASAPSLVGEWLVRREGERTLGRRVDLAAEARAIHDRLALPDHVVLDLPRVPEEARPLADLALAARSPQWDSERAAIDERLLFKAIPLGAVALLSFAVAALAILLQRRRAAYLELRGRLLAAVTHELKTPLASIRAMAETLERRLADHPGARDYPRRIVGASERLEQLVDNVLSFTRLERGAWRPRFEPIAVADLAAWLASEPAARAARPVDLTSDVPAGLTLVADVALVRLLLSNLLDNAARYATRERVKVRLRAWQDARGLYLACGDDGPGLGVRDPARLFSELERGRVEGVRGTGLGLSICNHVMRLHGGAITVAETSPAGTTFVATFPRRDGARVTRDEALPTPLPEGS